MVQKSWSDATWRSFRRGDAVRVSVGKPFYGKAAIIANAPLSRNNFDALIDALQEARAAIYGVGDSQTELKQ